MLVTVLSRVQITQVLEDALMVYCMECGKQIPDDAMLCPYCGRPVGSAQAGQGTKPVSELFTVPSGSGLDALSKDQAAQQLWLRRLVALIIDGIIVGVAVSILMMIIAMPMMIGYGMGGGFYQPYSWFGFGAFPLLSGVIFVGYFTFADSHWGGTVGKSLMGLKVTMDNGAVPTMEKALIRNISKVHWALLLLDVIIGLATQSEYGKKFTDKYAGTVVTKK